MPEVKVPEGYVPKPYHDPRAKLRELQPTLHHPPAPTPEECMTVEETMAELEANPKNAKLMRQIGVRESLFRVRACLICPRNATCERTLHRSCRLSCARY